MQEIFKNSVVGIAGLGGLGSNVAAALVRLGIGTLILVDFDTVEKSNLNRQQYNIDQIGRYKTEALTENLKKFNYLNISLKPVNATLAPDNIAEIFNGSDIIAECLDKADQKQMLVETVLAKMVPVPVVSVSGIAGLGNSNEITTKVLSDRHIHIGDSKSDAYSDLPLTSARVGIAAYHQANAIAEKLYQSKKRKTSN